MKKFIALAVVLLVVGLYSCGKSIDDLPCNTYNYGVVDVLNSSGEDRMLAYCAIDENDQCIGGQDGVEFVLVKPYIRGAVRLRLAPGRYHILIKTRDGNDMKDNAWEVTVKRCQNYSFHIQRNKVSRVDQPYHHLAVKATTTERTSDIHTGEE